MALTGFLRIDDIGGESIAPEHEDEIDVFGVQWGVESGHGASTRFGRRRSRPDVQPLVVHKYWDQSSVYLAQSVQQGRVHDEVVFTARRLTEDGAALDYLTITMENVVITDYEMMHTDPKELDERILERVVLEFEEITLLYTNADGEHETTLSERSFS